MQKGDQFVFDCDDVRDSHFKNFVYGKVYTIKSFTMVSLGSDEDAKPEMAIFFEDCEFGCYITYIREYFSTLEDFRNKSLKKILND